MRAVRRRRHPAGAEPELPRPVRAGRGATRLRAGGGGRRGRHRRHRPGRRVADRLDRSGHATVVLAGVLPARAGRARPSGGRGGARRGAVPLLQRPRGLQAVPRRAARAGRPGRPGRQAGGGVQLRAVAGGRARPGGRRPAVRGGGDLRQARGRQAGAGHLPGRPGAGRRRRRDDRARRRPARQRRAGGAGGRHHAGAAGPLRPRPRRRRAPGPEHDRAGRPARRGGLTGMDRSFWRVIANDENALPQGEWVAELTPELLGWLGSTDPELRDEFAYRILAAWIERGQYAPDQLRTMAKQMTANVELGLGEDGSDSVFLRTYSVLILMEIVAFDNASLFLNQTDLDGFLETALSYLRRERDLRSWVPGPGWANAVGHTADLLMMLARSPHLGAAELLAYAALNVLRRDLVDRSRLVAWLDRFTAAPGQESWRSAFASEADSASRANVTAFLRALYFQTMLTESPPRTPGRRWSALSVPCGAPTSAFSTSPEGPDPPGHPAGVPRTPPAAPQERLCRGNHQGPGLPRRGLANVREVSSWRRRSRPRSCRSPGRRRRARR